LCVIVWKLSLVSDLIISLFRCVVTGCTNEFWGLKNVVMAPLSTLQMSSAAMTPRNVASMYIYALAISYAYAAVFITIYTCSVNM